MLKNMVEGELLSGREDRGETCCQRYATDRIRPLIQQVRVWSFSPQGSTQEVEHYDVNLDRVSAIELSINPDISDRNAKATLLKWANGLMS